jgi:hypothetical protein
MRRNSSNLIPQNVECMEVPALAPVRATFQPTPGGYGSALPLYTSNGRDRIRQRGGANSNLDFHN